MPALPNAPGVLKCALIGSADGTETWLTRFYVKYSGTAPTVSDLTTLANLIGATFDADLKGLTSTSKDLFQVNVTDLTSPTAAAVERPATSVGTRAGAQNPPAACTVISYPVGRRYRGGHPRGYWPFGVSLDIGTDGQWTPAFLSTVNASIDAFFNTIGSGGGWVSAGTLAHVSVSYYQGFTVVIDPITGRARNVPKLRVGGPSIDPIIGFPFAKAIIGTQRRRGKF